MHAIVRLGAAVMVTAVLMLGAALVAAVETSAPVGLMAIIP